MTDNLQALKNRIEYAIADAESAPDETSRRAREKISVMLKLTEARELLPLLLFAAPAPAAAPGGETPETEQTWRWCRCPGLCVGPEKLTPDRRCQIYHNDVPPAPVASPGGETLTGAQGSWALPDGIREVVRGIPTHGGNIYQRDDPKLAPVASEETPRQNVRGLKVNYGEVCQKCGFSSCDHNEDPVDSCPNPDRVDLDNYTVADAPAAAQTAP